MEDDRSMVTGDHGSSFREDTVRLKDKVAIVTGARKGIGAGIALRLAQDGAHVVVNYSRSADGAQAVAANIRSLGRTAITVQADVSSPSALSTAD